MTTRIKADALPVPATEKEARELLREIGDLDRAVADIAEKLEADMNELKINAYAGVLQINPRIKECFLALKAFVEGHRDQVIPKKKKSVDWPTGTVGFRDTPLAASIANGKAADVIAALEARGFDDCVRVSKAIDKEGLKKRRAEVEDIAGIGFKSRTEFFAKPGGVEVEHVKAVAQPKVRRGQSR